jgi:uncharacterized protein (DUF1330 family)
LGLEEVGAADQVGKQNDVLCHTGVSAISRSAQLDVLVNNAGIGAPARAARPSNDGCAQGRTCCTLTSAHAVKNVSREEGTMSTYFVVEVEITNRDAMQPYLSAVAATLRQYGGSYLVYGGPTELIEGAPEPKKIAIAQFADKAAFKRWYDSPEYQRILPNRLANSTARAFVVEGLS